MNIYSIPPLIVSILFLFSGLFVFNKNRKSLVNITFAAEWMCVAIWLFGYFIVYNTTDINVALRWCRVVYVGVVFIPAFFYHFTSKLLQLQKHRTYIVLNYSLSFLFFSFLLFTDKLVTGVSKFFWGYQTRVGFLHNFFLAWFILVFLHCLFKIQKYAKIQKQRSAIEYNRLRYVFIAYIIASFGMLDAIPNYGIEFYPFFGFTLVGIGLVAVSYAIIKHHLMEIELIIRRTLIFAGLFLFVSMSFVAMTVLAQEFLSGVLGENTRWFVMLCSITIITLGMRPLETLLVRLTDKVLFQKKYDYQQTLKEASEGMTLVTDMRKLLNLIVRIVGKSIRVKSSAIFQLDDEKDKYVLKIRRGTTRKHTGYSLGKDNALVAWVKEHKETLIYDELEDWLRSERFLRKQKNLKENLEAIKQEMSALDGVVCVPSFSKEHLIGFLVLGEKLSGDIYTQEDIRLLSTLASEVAIAVENAKNFMELQKIRENERESYIQTVLALAQTVDEKDSYTHGHLENVTQYGMAVAEELMQSSEFKAEIDKEVLETALGLHDIGKIGIPDSILHKKGKLSPEEWQIMKQHCEIGARIVEPIEKFRSVGNIIKHHQEKYDGSGYPDGLKGEEIPIESRIIAVVDAYHAMVSDRPYRKAFPEKVALDELKQNIGTQFDPVIVAAFVRAWDRGKIK